MLRLREGMAIEADMSAVGSALCTASQGNPQNRAILKSAGRWSSDLAYLLPIIYIVVGVQLQKEVSQGVFVIHYDSRHYLMVSV